MDEQGFSEDTLDESRLQCQPLKIQRAYTAKGILWNPENLTPRDWLQHPFIFGADGDLVSFLSQLEDEGFAEIEVHSEHENLLLSWEALYQILSSNEHSASIKILDLPEQRNLRPILSSYGSLSDKDFLVTLAGWVDALGRKTVSTGRIQGAVLLSGGEEVLLPEASWKVVQSVGAFYSRPADERNCDSNRRAWAEIRRHAVHAKADLTDFLRKTIVLTPDKLHLSLNKTDVGETRSIEVIPSFDGSPVRWLDIFDRSETVRNSYDIPDGEGLVHVLISPEVRSVLAEIKAMPGRRVAGARAEAFIRNPFAALGSETQRVLDPEEFERACEDAGISFARFAVEVTRDAQGYPTEVRLLVEEILQGEICNNTITFENPDVLGRFAKKLEDKIARGYQCCAWEGYDLEILGETPDQLATLKKVLNEWQQPQVVSCAELFDLSRYSERVDGIGVEKPYYSPFIARKSGEEGWVPENIAFILSYKDEGSQEQMSVALDHDLIDRLRESVKKAKELEDQRFTFPGCPRPVPVTEAQSLLNAFDEAAEAINKGSFSPAKGLGPKEAKQGLVVKPNIEALDYSEQKGSLALPEGLKPMLPANLKAEIKLKEHQLIGVAWLQNLWRAAPSRCRGAVLADDMGLGKTLQLLAFVSSCLELYPALDPVLIVAPVALLENWKEEVEKFFSVSSLPIVTLYGDTLAEKRLSKCEMSSDLQLNGITRLLRPNWLGKNKIVLTTYETLRDLEFSFAAQKWSIMICDEAQKIKNPNALVTRAAKKQNVCFKIACTGTPVENTLTDLWCLFDFVQPGLLGALNRFGTHYRRPIEAKTDAEKEKVEELRLLINDQILRREKKDVAKDLPEKVVNSDCRALMISEFQRVLYGHAVSLFNSEKANDGKKSGILGLLSRLRLICSDPRPIGHQATGVESLGEIISRSPKMSWLLKRLEDINEKEEKVLIFCELLDLQRELKRCIHLRFGIAADIINGSTSASASNPLSRQKRIKSFQDRPGFGVIILSPLAAGFGLNIQAANHVIHFTRLWNPAKEDQATDRAYRIGQNKDVHVYYPVIVAEDFKTFDAKLDELLDWKRGLSSDMLNGTGELTAADFVDLQSIDGASMISDIAVLPEDIPKMAPDMFENFCTLLWTAQGFSRVYRTPRTNDGGIDVVAIGDGIGTLIQCKTSSKDGHRMGWDAIKDVVTGEAAYLRRHPEVTFRKVAVTNQYFNDAAHAQAVLNGVELLDRDNLEKILLDHPVRQGDLERLVVGRMT